MSDIYCWLGQGRDVRWNFQAFIMENDEWLTVIVIEYLIFRYLYGINFPHRILYTCCKFLSKLQKSRRVPYT